MMLKGEEDEDEERRRKRKRSEEIKQNPSIANSWSYNSQGRSCQRKRLWQTGGKNYFLISSDYLGKQGNKPKFQYWNHLIPQLVRKELLIKNTGRLKERTIS